MLLPLASLHAGPYVVRLGAARAQRGPGPLLGVMGATAIWCSMVIWVPSFRRVMSMGVGAGT